MKLSVVIVSYNVKYYLAQCLRSVEKAIGVLECGQQGDASGANLLSAVGRDYRG